MPDQSPDKPSLYTMFEEGLRKKIKEVDIKVVTAITKGIPDNKPLLVVCIGDSRPESDIQHALRRVGGIFVFLILS